MGESKHTPGPWTITGISQQTGSISVGSKDQRIVIADVTNASSFADMLAGAMKRGGGGFRQSDALTQFANAALIAAAPDMYEALKAARDEIKQLYSMRGCEAEGSLEDWTADIDAALLKAEGRNG